MKTIKFAILTLLLPALASAETYTLKSGVTDWSSVDSYTVGGEPATTLPGANDIIKLLEETFTLAASDAKFSDSIDEINAVKQVSIPSGAKLIIDVGTSDATITCLDVSACKSNSETMYTGNGTIEKRGTGVLAFSASSSGTSHIANLKIAAGTVAVDSSAVFGAADVATGATFRLGKTDANTFPVFRGPLTGAGTVESVSGSTKTVNLCLYWAESATETFSGTISGMIAIQARPGSVQSLAGPANTFSEGLTLGGRINAAKIGKKADASSSIGTDDTVVFGYAETKSGVTTTYAGTLGYLDTTGDETDRLFSFYYSPTANVIDAGEHGGLVLANEWKGDAKKSDYPSQQRVTLTGAGDNVMRGQIDDIVTDNGTYSFYVTKKGTGTWTVEENAASRMAGVWAAEEGTLKFATFAPLGEFCALGFSTNLYGDVWGAENMTEANRVDYAFLLGGTNAAAPGTMEYSGSDYLLDTTRKIAVKGTGRLTATTAQTAYANVVSAQAGETATLVLDGPANVTNDLVGVSNGDGTLGLVKAGAGTWRLAGDNSFSGPVAVTGGTLIVSTPDTTKYSYYRFTVKETYGVKNNLEPSKYAEKTVCCIDEFSLYDADRLPINADLVSVSFPIAQTPGTVFLRDSGSITDGGDVSEIFDYNGNTYPMFYYSDKRGMPDHTKTNTWMTFTLRLASGVSSASYFDLAVANGNGSSSNNRVAHNPTAWTIEASCDGYTWDQVNEQDDASKWVPTSQMSYYSDGVAVNTRKRKQGPEFPADFTLSRTVPAKTDMKPFGSAKSVRVDKGATLVKEGPGAVEVNELVIDRAAGLGTLSGFTLASASTIAVNGVAKSDKEIVLPGTLDVAGLDTTTWTVKVNGAVTTKYDVTVATTGVKLVKRCGLTLVFR